VREMWNEWFSYFTNAFTSSPISFDGHCFIRRFSSFFEI
jgi:hypothetical protein